MTWCSLLQKHDVRTKLDIYVYYYYRQVLMTLTEINFKT